MKHRGPIALVVLNVALVFHGAEAAQDHTTTAPECSEVAAYLGQPELALSQASCDRAYITMQDGWCAHPPSSSAIAVCSEPQLKSLARERKKAYDAAQTHLDPGARATLKEDQDAWGASYAQTCGITPKLAPTLPLAAQIKECMARAGRARLAYLREYGTPSNAPAQPVVSAPTQPPSAIQQTDADKNAEKMPCYNSWVAHHIKHQFPYNSATTWQDTLDMLIKTKNTYKSNSDQLDTFIEIDKNRISHLEEILSTPYSEMKRRFDSLPVLPDDDLHDRAQQDGLDIVSENWCTLKIEVPYIKEDLERLTKLQAAQR